MESTTEQQIDELTRMLEAKVGPLATLYDRVFDGNRIYSVEEAEQEAEEDEEEGSDPPFLLLCPPASWAVADDAERRLGFALPPLLRAVYTRIGNGGYCLGLIGLEGGQGGYDDLGFRGESAVVAYETMVREWTGPKGEPWPAKLVPIDDGLGCGMIDAVDCGTPEGVIHRADTGEISRRLPSLYDYFAEAIERCNMRAA